MINFITKSGQILMYLKMDSLNLHSVEWPLIKSTELLPEIYRVQNTSDKELLEIFVQKMRLGDSLHLLYDNFRNRT